MVQNQMVEVKMKDAELISAWEERIADYRGSELTMIQWCEKTGYSIGQLKYWITKLNKLSRNVGSSGWARIGVVDSGANIASGISVSVGAARIEVCPGFDPSLLSEVLRVVTSTC
jgi:hypothetical protein